LDSKVVAADRCKEKTISRKGRQIDRWYSGKAHGFGGSIQALFSPGGIPLRETLKVRIGPTCPHRWLLAVLSWVMPGVGRHSGGES
jgi:hypothetical protein